MATAGNKPVFVTSDVLALGRKECVTRLRAKLSDLLGQGDEAFDQVSQYFYELIWAVLKGRPGYALEEQPCVEILRGMGFTRAHQEALLDHLFIACHYEPCSKAALSLVRGLQRGGVVSLATTLGNMEPHMGVPAEIVSPEVFRRKIMQARTKQLYSVKKYNTFRECSEGYAAAMETVWSVSSRRSKDEALKCGQELKRIIAHYQLCPTRVCAMVVDTVQWWFGQAMRRYWYGRKSDRAAKGEPELPSSARFAEVLEWYLEILRGYHHTQLMSVLKFYLSCYNKIPFLVHTDNPPISIHDIVPPADLHAPTSARTGGVQHSKRDSATSESHSGNPADSNSASAIRLARSNVLYEFAGILIVLLRGDLISPTELGEELWEYMYMHPRADNDPVIAKLEAEATESYKAAINAHTAIIIGGSAEDPDQKMQKAIDALSEYRDIPTCLVQAALDAGDVALAKRIVQRLQFSRPALLSTVRQGLTDELAWLLCTSGDTRSRRHMARLAQHPLRNYSDPSRPEDPLLEEGCDALWLIEMLGSQLCHDTACLGICWQRVGDAVAVKGCRRERLDSLVARVLLPALSCAAGSNGANPWLATIAWESYLKGRPVEDRYQIYALWDQAGRSDPADLGQFPLQLVHAKVRKETKSLLKRIVKDAQQSEDKLARYSPYAWTKLALMNPLPCAQYVVHNLTERSNSNLIGPYIDVTGRSGDMTCDTVGYELLCEATNPRLTQAVGFLNKESAVIEGWIQNLSEFAGRFYRKHSHIDMRGLLKVIRVCLRPPSPRTSTDQETINFLLGQSLMRQLLQGLISYVGGFTVIAELNDEQVQCLSGGPVLCALSQTINPEAGGIGGTGGSTGGRYSERARAALRAAMTQEGPTLIQSFWHSLMAQRDLLVSHSAIINGFTENKGGLKLLGYLLDTSHTQLLQLTQYLVLVTSTAHPYSDLLPDIHQLFRPKGHRLMADQLPLAFHLCRPGLPPYGVLPAEDEKDRQTIVAELSEAVKPFLPGHSEEALDGLSLGFYLTFWRLSLYDIYVPCDSYKKQIALMEREMVEMQGAAEGRPTAATPSPTKQTIKRAKKEIHRLKEHIDKLRVEETLQLENHHRVLERLRRECGGWWKQEVGNEQATIGLVKWMLAQRVMLSVQDALFCAHFVKLLVTLHPPGFQLLDFYNVATTLLMVLVQCCTESEARWFGVFLRDIMHYVKDLRSIGDSTKFADYVAGNSAFYRHYRPYGEKDAEYLKLSELKKGHAKWEGRVCKALKPGLEKSADWSEKRNALTVLISCHEYCPVHYRSARAVMHQLEALSKDQGQPPDIKTMAGGLLSKMKQREDSILDRPPPKPAHDHAKTSDGQNASTEAHGKSAEVHNERPDGHTRTTSSGQGHALNALSSPGAGVKRTATDSPNSTTTSPEGKKLKTNDERSERSSARERGRPPRE